MAINKKLIYYNRTLANFKSDANGLNGQTTASGGNVGNIPYASIVFTSDGYIWTHGKEFNCNNTWRGIQNNLTSTSTTDSLSAYQGKILNEKFANYLPLSGGTLTGALTVPSLTVTGASTFSQAINGSILGNAATASRLQNARTINGTSFDGSANITTANWGTARNISIADSDSTNTGTAVSVNGSAAVTLKLPATIKAALSGNATSATKATNDSDGNAINTTYLKKSGGAMTGMVTWAGGNAINFRTGHDNYNAIIGYYTPGNEALVLGLQNAVTSFIVKSGVNLTGKTDWQSATIGTPSIQVKGQSLYVNSAIGNGVSPSYNFYVGGSMGISGQITSTVATGTAPLVVASTTAVANLNADLLDGQHGSYYASASSLGSYVTLSTAQTISGNKTFSSSVSIDDLTAGNLVVTGGASFALTINGNAATANKVNHTLTFTGYSTGTFDGLADKSIAIPSNTNQLTNGAGFITASSNITGTAAGITGYTFKSGITNTSNSGWTNTSTDDKIIPTMNFIAYWNGAYNSGGSSNLTYCCKGAFGTATTHAHTDYVTSITYDSTNKKLQQSKGGGTATDIVTFGTHAFDSTAYLPTSGGTLSNTNFYVLTLNGGSDGSGMLFSQTGDNAKLGLLLFKPSDWGIALAYYSISKAIGIKTDGTPYYGWGDTKYTLYHTGNLSPMTTSHAANGITSTKISNWDAVYTWYTTAAGTSASGVIDNWNEIKNFIDGFHESDDLAEYLVNTFVAKTGGTMTGALTTPSLTVTGASSFSLAINGSILGNATTASRLLNARTISLTGNVTGSASFDGSGNISISTTVSGGTATDSTKLPLAGGWMNDQAQLYFKGKSGSTTAYTTIGYRASLGAVMHLGGTTYNNQGFYIASNGYDAANDWGGLAIDNDGVTVFGAGDTGSVFRVLNEDSVNDGALFWVTKASGAGAKHGFTSSGYTLDNGENWGTISVSRTGIGTGSLGGIDGNGMYFAQTPSGGSTTTMYLKGGTGLSLSSGLLQITNYSNTVTIGSQNSSWCHFTNSANIPFYFGRSINVDGVFKVYNTSYEINSGTSVLNDLRVYGADLYIGSASGSQCHQQYDSTNKVLKFLFD